MKAADELTVRVEQQIRSSGDRYEVIGTQSWDYDPCETWTMVRDSRAEESPIRVFLEEGNEQTHTYTMREGAFPDRAAARDWLDTRDVPLPEPPESHGVAAQLRTSAALARSAGPAVVSKAGAAAATAPASQRPAPRRSM